MDIGARREARGRHGNARDSPSGSDSARSQASSGSRQRNVEVSGRRPSAEGASGAGCRHAATSAAEGSRIPSGCRSKDDARPGSNDEQSRGESGFGSRYPNEDGSSLGSRRPSAESSSPRSRVSSEESRKPGCRHRHRRCAGGGRDRGDGGERADSNSGSGGTSYRSDIDDDEDDEEEGEDNDICRRGRSCSCVPGEHRDVSAMSSNHPSDSCSCCCCGCGCGSSECGTERTGSTLACSCCACRDRKGQALHRLQGPFQGQMRGRCCSERASLSTRGPGSPTRLERAHRLKDVAATAVDGKGHKTKRGSGSSVQDDRESAGRAVALVINGARRGFVPLCVDVAGLLRSRRRLRKVVESQALEIERLRELLGHVVPAAAATAEDSSGGSCASSAGHHCTAPRRHSRHQPRTAPAHKQCPHCAILSDQDWDEENATECGINGTKPDACFLPPVAGAPENVLHCASLEEALSASRTHRADVHSAAEQVAAQLSSLAVHREARDPHTGRDPDESSSGSTCSGTCTFGQTSVSRDKAHVCDVPGPYGGTAAVDDDDDDAARTESAHSPSRRSRRSNLSLASGRPGDGSLSGDESPRGAARRQPPLAEPPADETPKPEPSVSIPHGPAPPRRSATRAESRDAAAGVAVVPIQEAVVRRPSSSEEGASASEPGITHSFDPGVQAQPRARRSMARKSGQAGPSSPAPQQPNGALRRLKGFQLSQLTCKLRR